MDFIDVLRIILVILHFVGLASLLGGFLVQVRAIGAGRGTVVPAMVHGALTQLVTGILLVAVAQMGDLYDVDNVKIAFKLAITIAITVLVFVFRKREPAPSWALWLIGGLTLANVVIAVAWR
jgi:Na+-driven multidrug efflux pump